jgi:hypothetical protein
MKVYGHMENAKWWQKITRPFGSGETNTHITIQKSKKKTNKTKNKSKDDRSGHFPILLPLVKKEIYIFDISSLSVIGDNKEI